MIFILFFRQLRCVNILSTHRTVHFLATMYPNIDLQKNIETATTYVIDNDRSLLLPFFECAEKFCITNKVLIGGKVGIDLIIGRPLTKDSFFWELYCDDTYNTAKQLTIALSEVATPHVPADTTYMQTRIKHREFSIFVYARMLFAVYSLDKYRGIKLIDLMGPAQRTSYLHREPILCLSEEMYLIDLYRSLYTPAKVATWKVSLENEAAIYKLIEESIMKKAVAKVGGSQSGHNELPKISHKMLPVVIQKLSKTNVIIGELAVAIMQNDTQFKPQRLQIISADTIEDIMQSVSAIVKTYHNCRVIRQKYHVNLPNDFQITKYTLYISNGRDQLPLVEVFNSAQYEMIPYKTYQSTITNNNKTLMIANPWVLLRFLFIDMWILKLILNLAGTTSERSITEKILKSVSLANTVRAKIMESPLSTADTFQLTDYIGCYIPEAVAKKKLIKEIGERLPLFFPAKLRGDRLVNKSINSSSIDRSSIKQNETDTKIEVTELPNIQSDKSGEPIESSKTKMEIETKMDNVEETGEIKGGSLTDQPITRFTTQPINLAIDFNTKAKLVKKITNRYPTRQTMMKILTDYAGTVDSNKWGSGRSLDSYYRRNRVFIPYLKNGTLLDFGCGDGVDCAAIKLNYDIVATAADIADNRKSEYKSESQFCLVEPGKPLDLPDNTFDIITMFHVIHHMRDDVKARLRDIYRLLKPGGVLLIKDHDVLSATHASNVDFEHFVYHIGETKVELTNPSETKHKFVQNAMQQYPEIEPMWYYSAKDIQAMVMELNMEQLWTGSINIVNYTFGSVFYLR